MSDFAHYLLQQVLPKQGLTRLAGRWAGWKGGAWTEWGIRRFIHRYGVDMSEAAQEDPAGYASFNEFFTRALKPGARPIAQADLVCPVDGSISQFGPIEGDQIFQAKGHRYSTRALVGGDAQLAKAFEGGGHFATLYLSPRDYHRIHMPCAATLVRMIHVPGDLYSVNPATARTVPGLFARNERVVCVFETAGRPWVLVLVGATIVGSMATAWHGVIERSRSGPQTWDYREQPVLMRQGQEMGRFMLGSTVVLLLPPAGLRFNAHWRPGGAIRMGEPMANWA
ncbi:MAG: archaetidylserine decarboxylase [Betaproteobacteria bacterium]